MLTRKHPPRPVKTVESLNLAPRPIARGSGLLAAALALPEAEPVRERATASPAEKAHMGRVKLLRCVLCRRLGQQQDGPTEVHHLREEQGGAQRASNWLTAALCSEGCHRGPAGIHGSRARLRQAKCTEIDLLAWTLEDLAATTDPG
jgi:hypothetical protein